MMVVGAAAVGRGISETGKIEMDGQMGRGVHNISNKKFLLILLSWKEKKKKKRPTAKKVVGVSGRCKSALSSGAA